ncbi:MAG: FtsQ-type POTRA domain-containing protein [Candidatus Omnitrophica bacterium]|nr:FtsQ-type POTRA domain-containing protein [Candidatus Omnitrophota bacterium]
MAKDNVKKRRPGPKRIEPAKAKAVTKKILPFLVAFILILTVFLFFRNSSYFKLEHIQVNDLSYASGLDRHDLLRLYKGRNIFDININALSSRIKHDYPTVKNAVVKRVLPNRLEIDVIPRIPVARIKARRYFPVDRTGMILSPGIKSGKLPTIIGFSAWARPRVGENLKSRQLESAFLLLDALKESSILSDYNLTTIDVSNYKNISFYIDDTIEVKIGGEDFRKRLEMLKTTLQNPDLDKKNIKYLDLRFKDVVIGPR